MDSASERWKSVFLIGGFVFLFLYIFKPFGLSNVEGSIFLVTLLYGLITSSCLVLTLFILPIIFPDHYNESEWNVGREMLHSLGNILIIAALNFLFSAYLEFFPWSTNTFLLFLGFTIAVGVIPVTISVLYRQNILHKKNIEAVKRDNLLISEKPDSGNSHEEIRIKSEDGKSAFEGDLNEIFAVSSAGNYVEVFLDGQKPLLIRNSLSKVAQELPKSFVRTHRSWLVNLNNVKEVDGNARGYQIKFAKQGPIVPVSRSNLKLFDQALRDVLDN